MEIDETDHGGDMWIMFSHPLSALIQLQVTLDDVAGFVVRLTAPPDVLTQAGVLIKRHNETLDRQDRRLRG